MRMPLRFLAAPCLLLALLWPASASGRHVVLVVVDGPRSTEFLEEPGRPHAPRLDQDLLPLGCGIAAFRNEGLTQTIPGHSALLTGTAQPIANDGSTHPDEPTLFERLRKSRGLPAAAVWLIAGKDKLTAASWSTHPDYGAAYAASVDATLRSDAATFSAAAGVLVAHRPELTCVNLAGVDLAGHSGNWNAYLAALSAADSLVFELWSVVQGDPVLAGDTDFLVVADHGRHDDTHGGFVNHGDACAGCRALPFAAIGPDFRPGYIREEPARQEDVARTLGWLLDAGGPPMEGFVLVDLLVNPPALAVPGDGGTVGALTAGPNPFTRDVTVSGLPGLSAAVDVLDARGRLVYRDAFDASGRHRWAGLDGSGRPAPPGVYWIRVHDAASSRALRVVKLP